MVILHFQMPHVKECYKGKCCYNYILHGVVRLIKFDKGWVGPLGGSR
ncbi:hypothetical protein HanRHA438_Chr01g0025321 [Helianthus annuus]|nr:hypothetical protein HanRHA438_Chr01g0025321 [Helianthus annuus]